jgi:hypothetical protein
MKSYTGKPDTEKKTIYDCTQAGDGNAPLAAGESVVDCVLTVVDTADAPRISVYV